MWYPLPDDTFSGQRDSLFSWMTLPDSIMSIINFRTSYTSRTLGETTTKSRSSYGVDFDTIWLYQWGDTRNIVWKRSTENDIYEKSYYTHESIYVHIIYDDDKSWWFQMNASDFSKYDWLDTLVREVEKSLVKSGWRSHTEQRNMMKKEYKNSIILFLSSSCEEKSYTFLARLRKKNDVIVLLLSHEKEEKVAGNFYEWWFLWLRYMKDRKGKIADLKSSLAKDDIPLLEANTWDNPSLLLNHFFKTRYAR